jgi:hypothetical protein
VTDAVGLADQAYDASALTTVRYARVPRDGALMPNEYVDVDDSGFEALVDQLVPILRCSRIVTPGLDGLTFPVIVNAAPSFTEFGDAVIVMPRVAATVRPGDVAAEYPPPAAIENTYCVDLDNTTLLNTTAPVDVDVAVVPNVLNDPVLPAGR